MWPWILLKRYICWRWSLRTSSLQFHNNPVLDPPRKPPDPVKYLYDGQTYYLKSKGGYMDEDRCGSSGVWNILLDISLDYVVFQFVTGINFKWDYLIWQNFALLIWIGIWTKLRIYRVTPDPVRWSCQGYGFLCQAFMLNWMLWTKNNFKVSHRKQVKATSMLLQVELLPRGTKRKPVIRRLSQQMHHYLTC